MKTLLVAASSIFLICFTSFAQRRGAGGVTYTTPSGYGSVAYPGTGGPSFATRLGSTVAGRGISRSSQRYSGGLSGGLGGYPLYVGGAYIPSFAQDYSDQTQLAPSPQQQYSAPPVVINQFFGAPPQQFDSGPAAPTSTFYQPSAQRAVVAEESSPASQFYLLAFKDHSVYSARAYWIEDKTLHYVTPQNTHNQASLDLVDVDFTKQLNRNHDVPFTIQPSPAQ